MNQVNLSAFFEDEEDEKPGIKFFDMSQIALAAAFQEFQNTPIKIGMLRHIVLNSIRFNLKKFNDEYPITVLAFDNANNGYWRRDYGYYYKKTRAAARDENSTFDWEGYFTAINQIKEEFKENMPYYTIDIPRVEADDIIGVLTLRECLDRKIMIISSDGDYKQLHISDNVKQWAPQLKKMVKSKESIPEFLMTKLLKGDRKDTVAGVKCRSDYWFTRVEGERAPSISTKLIQSCLDDGPEKHLSEEELKRYNENKVMIDMTFIPDDIKQKITSEFDNFKVPGRSKIYPYFVKTGLVKLTKDINMF